MWKTILREKPAAFLMLGDNEKCSFGRVTWDTTLDDPTIECAIVNIDNEVVGRHLLSLSQLSD